MKIKVKSIEEIEQIPFHAANFAEKPELRDEWAENWCGNIYVVDHIIQDEPYKGQYQIEDDESGLIFTPNEVELI